MRKTYERYRKHYEAYAGINTDIWGIGFELEGGFWFASLKLKLGPFWADIEFDSWANY
jgi:hypothetical protein